MKKILAVSASAFMLLTTAAPATVFAKDGPNIATLVPIDESRYDIDNRKSVDKSDVLNRLTKETYFREIFQVTEIQRQPQTAYIVRETRSKNVTVTEDEDVFVRVNKVPQVNTPGWSYINR
jgi:hypothetical protein